MSHKISIVIPLHNEGQHFATSFHEIVAAAKTSGIELDFVLIDDGSRDDTWKIVQQICSDATNAAQGLRLSRNFGKEAAIAAGLKAASGDAVVVMDGDLQHPPDLIPKMIEVWRQGADIVEAVKSSRGNESLFRRYASLLYYRILHAMSGLNLAGASDFKLLSRHVVDYWLEMPERTLFFRGIVAWLGFDRRQLTFAVENRVAGQSAWSILKLFGLAFSSITAFSSLPLQLVSVFGVISIFLGTVIGGIALFDKLTHNAVDGFTTVILVQLILGGMILIGMGVLGQYMARIFEETKQRPRFVIREKSPN